MLNFTGALKVYVATEAADLRNYPECRIMWSDRRLSRS